MRVIVVGLTGLVLTLACWRIMLTQAHTTDALRFDRLAGNVRNLIDSRLQYQAQILGGLEGLFAASKSVERGEFRAYVNSLQLPEHTGALGFGFVRYVHGQDVEAFLARTRADEAPNFSIRTLGDPQSDRYIIEYIEPFEINRAARGLDIATESHRRDAAVRAVSEDKIILSRTVTLIQDEKKIAGFLLLCPVYRNGTSTTAISDRWQNLIGWVYTPIRIDELMAGVTEVNNQQVDFEVFEEDGARRKSLLYDADNHLRKSTNELVSETEFASRLFHRVFDYEFGGRHWRIHVSTRPEFTAGYEHQVPNLVLLSGLIGTALLTYLVNTSRRVQQKAIGIAQSMTSELREEIAHRQSAEHAMRTAALFQETILNSAAYAIISTTPEGIIRVFNPAAQRMLGYTEDEMIGRQTPAIFHDPEEVARRAQEFSAELGCPLEPGFEVFVIKSCRGLPNDHEWTFVRKDGTRLPVLLSVTAIRDEQGNFTGFLGLGIDITERKRTLDEVLAARLRSDEALHEVQSLRDAMDQHAIVSITDLRGQINYVNDRFVAISGYSRKEIIGRTHQIINSGTHSREFWVGFWQTITAGNVWHGEICNRAKAGHLYWVSATVVPFRNAEGEIDRFVSIRTEITNRIKAEAELIKARQVADAASKSKSDFLAEMSHEIRTPMNAVLGFTDLLAETPLNERQHKFVETIQTSGKNLLCLINDILDYSKIEAGKLSVERVPFDMLKEAEHVVNTLTLQASQRQLTLSLDCSAKLTHQAIGDPGRVRQILLNLIGNALKFTKQGGVTLAFQTLSTDQESFVRINVTDTGIGLTPEQQARLFTRYQQASQTTTRDFGGTGLGLAICKRLVELMGGQIGVQSKPGHGSTFWFTIPLGAPSHPSTTGQPPAATATSSAAPGKTASGNASPKLRVLVADDNLINQQLACAFLARLDCMYVTANDGEEATQLATTKQFDLVLMDYQMPNLNGMEATTAIRHWEQSSGRTESLPIYALTANHDPEIKKNFLVCGMQGVLSKPLIMAELAEILDSLRKQAQPGPAAKPALPPTPPPPANTSAPGAVSTSAPPGSAMDRARALALTDNNPMLLGMLAQAFLGQCDGIVANIKEAFQARDAKALKAHAHKLKGAISVFAADRAAAVVLALNKFPEPADWNHLDQLHQELISELTRLRPEIVTLTAPQPTQTRPAQPA